MIGPILAVVSRTGSVILTVVGLVLLGIAGLVAAFVGWANGSPAVAQTRIRAVKIFNAMETYPGTTVYDQAEEGAKWGDVEIMVAKNDPELGPNGRRIVLAITAHAECKTNWECATKIWHDDSQPYSATRCFEWTSQRRWDAPADEVDCPAKRDIDTTRAKTVDVPDDAEARIKAALRSADAAARLSALTGLPDLQVRADGKDVYVSTGGITGYWTGRMETECVLGWKTASGVEVVRLHASAHEEPVSCGWENARARAKH